MSNVSTEMPAGLKPKGLDAGQTLKPGARPTERTAPAGTVAEIMAHPAAGGTAPLVLSLEASQMVGQAVHAAVASTHGKALPDSD